MERCAALKRVLGLCSSSGESESWNPEEMQDLFTRLAERYESGSLLASRRAPTGSFFAPDEDGEELWLDRAGPGRL